MTISVIVPHYNQPTMLDRCLRALADQSQPALEIIVVDDGSQRPPASPPPVGPADLRVIMAPHRGPAAARNAGAAIARGQVLAFTDCDCRPSRDWLRSLWEAIGAGPATLATGPVVDVTPARRTSPLRRFMQRTGRLDLGPQHFTYGSTRMLGVIGANLAVRAGVFAHAGGFDERFPRPGGEDYDLGLRLQMEGKPAVFVPDAVVEHDYPTDWRALVRRWRSYGLGKAIFAEKHGLPRAALHLLDAGVPFHRVPREVARLARQHFGPAFRDSRFPWVTALFVEALFQLGARERAQVR